MSAVLRRQWESRLHEHLPNAFHARILDVDVRTAEEWGLVRGTRSAGEILPAEESLIIATARVNGFSLLARRAAHHCLRVNTRVSTKSVTPTALRSRPTGRG